MSLNGEEENDDTRYKVVVNPENQHALWPADKELPLNWIYEGMEGSREECLAYIKEQWKDKYPSGAQKVIDDLLKNIES